MAYKKKYTDIDEVAREQFNLLYEEYAIANSIYVLSTNPDAPVPGWCNASKQYIAEFLGGDWLSKEDIEKYVAENGEKPRTRITEKSMYNYLNLLLKKKLIERHPTMSGFLRTTKLWYDTVQVYQTDEKPKNSKQKNLQGDCKSYSPTLNNLQEETVKVTASIDTNKYEQNSESDKKKNSLTFSEFIFGIEKQDDYEEWRTDSTNGKKYDLSHYFIAVTGHYEGKKFTIEQMKAKIYLFIGNDRKSKIHEIKYLPEEKRNLESEAWNIVLNNLPKIKDELSEMQDYEIVYELLKDDKDHLHKEATFEGKVEMAVKYYRTKNWGK